MSTTPIAPEQLVSLMHHHEYGHPGEPQSERVFASNYESLKAFSSPSPLTPWSVAVPTGKLEALVNGFAPKDMDDKWVIFTDGEAVEGNILTVNFHRSWTGYKNLVLEVEVGKDGEGKVKTLMWETDKKRYNVDGLEEVKETIREVCRWILSVELGPDE